MGVLIPQRGHIEAPFAIDKRLEQELYHPFFIYMLTHDGGGLLARRDTGIGYRIDGRKDLIVTAYMVIDRGNIDSDELVDAFRRQCGKGHHRFPPHGVTNEGCALDTVGIKSIQ